MTISVLITAPKEPKLFVDLVIAAERAHRLHPELRLDVLAEAAVVPAWWQSPGTWLRLHTTLSAVASNYDLVVHTYADETLARELATVTAEARSGVVTAPTFQVQGRWAQTLVALLGCQRFSPFTPVDLFEHILLGRLSRVSYPAEPRDGHWVVDLDSFSDAHRGWAEDALRTIATLFPGRVKDRWSGSAQSLSGYVGANPALASWLSAQGTKCFLVWDFIWEAKFAPANPTAWVVDANNLPGQSELLGLLRSPELTSATHFRYTDEFLGGNLRSWRAEQLVGNPHEVLALVHYVVLNYVNDLCEVDVPIPRVDASCCLRLKSCQLVLRKVSELNLFAIKFLNDFITKVSENTAANDDVRELMQKINEVDELATNSLSAFPELDLLRLWSHFLKAAASGESTLEISKSLILVYHEISQAFEASSELLLKITQRYTEAPSARKDSP